MYVFKSYIIKLKKEIIEPLTACYKPEAYMIFLYILAEVTRKCCFVRKNTCVYM